MNKLWNAPCEVKCYEVPWDTYEVPMKLTHTRKVYEVFKLKTSYTYEHAMK